MHIFIYLTLFVATSNVIAPKSNLIVQSDFAMRSGKELNYIKYVWKPQNSHGTKDERINPQRKKARCQTKMKTMKHCR